MLEGLKTARGIVRSLRIYYGHRARSAAMDRLYSRFVQRGDLVFDVGAHVGDRIASFRRLGARVVADRAATSLGEGAQTHLRARIRRHDRGGRRRPQPGNGRVDDQSRQSHGLDRFARLHQRRARCSRLGSATLDQDNTTCR